MPIMNGYKTASKIREYEEQNETSNKAYIVSFSGNVTEEHFRNCKISRINETLQKPATREQIEHLLTIFN